MPIEYSTDDEEVVEESTNDSSETTHIPMSLLAGKKVSPGDVVRLEVVETDEDGGFIKVKYAQSKESKSSAIEDAATAFNPVSKMEAM